MPTPEEGCASMLQMLKPQAREPRLLSVTHTEVAEQGVDSKFAWLQSLFEVNDVISLPRPPIHQELGE